MNRVTTNCTTCGKELEAHRKNKYYDCSACHSQQNRKYRKKYTELTKEQKLKERCRANARRYYKKGIIKKKDCLYCGDQKTEMHHDDYRFPKSVQWLCKLCHSDVHKRIDQKRRQRLLAKSSTK